MEPDRPAVSTAAFWDGLYAAAQDGWDLGGAAPALEDWLAVGRLTSSALLNAGARKWPPHSPGRGHSWAGSRCGSWGWAWS